MNKVYCKHCKHFTRTPMFDYSYRYINDSFTLFSDSPICLHNFEDISKESAIKPNTYSEIVGYRPALKNKDRNCQDFEPRFWCSLKLAIRELINKYINK